MNAYQLVEKHGKQFTKELVDMMLINTSTNSEVIRRMLLKNKIIKPSTKIIRARMSRRQIWGRLQNGRWGRTGDMVTELTVQNGRGNTIVFLGIKDSEIYEVGKALHEE